MIKISIIIATCNFNILKPCIEAIVRTTDLKKCDGEVIVAMNGCCPDAIPYIQGLGNGFRFIWIDRRVGVASALNLAAKIADGEYLIRMDDDTTILNWGGDNGWINTLMEPFTIDEKVGQSGPYFERTFGNYVALVGCLAMTPKKLWDQIGGLDETFDPGLGDDIDYSIKVQIAGYKVVQTPPYPELKEDEAKLSISYYPIHHTSVGDYGNGKMELIKRNHRILRNRYGDPINEAAYKRMGFVK